MHTLTVCERNVFRTEQDLTQISELLAQPKTLVWLDVESPDAGELELLREEFGFHPLAIEDAAQHFERPKIDAYPGYYLLVFYAARYDGAARELHLSPLTIFIGPNYLISIRRDPVPQLSETLARWQSASRSSSHAVSTVLHALLDAIVDDYFTLLDIIVDRIEDLESAIFNRYSETVVGEIFRLKKDLLLLRRVAAPARDVVNVLLRQEVPIFQPRDLAYIQDVYDHLVRVTESIDTYRELLSSALESFLSLQGNQLNQLVKMLTLWSVILMSCALVAGIYGMNFVFMPELNQPWGYPFALGLMLTIGLGLAAFFKSRKWW